MRRIITTGLLLLFIWIPVTSAESQERLILTLEESVRLALEQNPELQIAKKELDKSKAGVWEAYAAILPALNGSVNFQHAWEIQEQTIPNFIKPMLGGLEEMIPELGDMPDFVTMSFGLENTFTYGLQLTQPLFLGGAGIAGVQMANAQKRASQHNLESRRQHLIYQTANGFYACLLAHEMVKVQREALNQAEANLDVVRKKYEAGSASGFEKMRAEVEVANLKPAVIAAENQRQSALTGLRMVLGLPDDRQIEVQGELAFVQDEMDQTDLGDLQQRAYEHRPELAAMAAQKAMASKGVAIARSQFLPKVFFSTDYSFLAMRNDYEFEKDHFSKGFTSAISLQIPLFNAMKNHKQYQKARLDYRIMQDTEKQVRDGIAAEVEIAFNTFKEAREKYFAADESIDLAEEALRLANLTYEEGASTQLDVLGSQLALTQARMNYISALYEYQLARYKLRRVSGTLRDIL